MDRHTIIFTTDDRQNNLGKLLEGEKIVCTYDEYREKYAGKKIHDNVYVLPTPVNKLEKNTEVAKKLKEDLKFERNPAIVFGGVLQEPWEDFLQKNGIAYWDFMKLPHVIAGNAHITAEATVAKVIMHGKFSILGQKVLITGYGYCAKALAQVFGRLGARVLVVARRQEAIEQARSDGFEAVDFEEAKTRLWAMDTVVNTVPALVVTREWIEKLKKDALIIDIASSPGGTDFEAAKDCNITARLELGLPGRYTTMSSARLLKQTISKYAPLEQDVREDRQWIFQIII